MKEAAGGDRQLARRMLEGQETAFEEFFDGYFPALYRFALSRLHSNEDAAEEVAQVTLCKALSSLATFRGEASLFTWLCTICRHEISAHFRRNRWAAKQTELTEDIPAVRSALESLPAVLGDGPEQALDRKELGRLVQVVLDQLPSHYGDALEWKYIDELPVKDIATRLGMTPKAAESLLTRSREAFRDGFSALVRAASQGHHGKLSEETS
ncbi:MAG TPA: sigma-70 family RNA polymerase sigma factor [Candidatus Polarisedimenticolaceae bacterium]|nr:sigma-70 family RNA polymerase sigma factor [Candidatus Polarisedimenticolaceae bacterium]